MSEKALAYKTKELAELWDKPVTSITLAIRKGDLKARKVGKEYLIEKKEANRFLGIESNEDSLRKELYIKELQGKVKELELKLSAVQTLIKSTSSLLE